MAPPPIQPIRFSSIGAFLDALPDEELALVERLRGLIFDTLPDVTERLAYNVPFYYRHRRVCFIWPASVPWGNVKGGGVQLGFCEGHRLPDAEAYLEKGNRKQVYTKTFRSVRDLEPAWIRAYLLEAARVDDALHHAKKR